VNVGRINDTRRSGQASIRGWVASGGADVVSERPERFVTTATPAAANGPRLRLWKWSCSRFANERVSRYFGLSTSRRGNKQGGTMV